MALPLQGQRKQDKNHFYNSEGTVLRLQAFLLVRNEDREIACVRLEDESDGWLLPAESFTANEDPADAARRVAQTYFETPLSPRIVGFQNYPDDGDKRWYVIFLFEADAPAAGLKATSDTLEVAWVAPGKAPGPFRFDHETVFERIK